MHTTRFDWDDTVMKLLRAILYGTGNRHLFYNRGMVEGACKDHHAVATGAEGASVHVLTKIAARIEHSRLSRMSLFVLWGSFYEEDEILKFVNACNKTIQSILNRVHQTTLYIPFPGQLWGFPYTSCDLRSSLQLASDSEVDCLLQVAGVWI